MELKIYFNHLNTYFTTDKGLKIIYSCADVMRGIWLTNREFVQQAAKEPKILLKHFMENTFSKFPIEAQKYLVVEPHQGTSEIDIYFKHKDWILDNLKQRNYNKYKVNFGTKYQYFFKIPLPKVVYYNTSSVTLESFLNKKFQIILKKLNKNILKDLKIFGMDLMILNYNISQNSLTIKLNLPVIIASGIAIKTAIKHFLKKNSEDEITMDEIATSLGKDFDFRSSDEIRNNNVKDLSQDVFLIGGMIYIIDKNFKKLIKELESYQDYEF